MKTSIPLLLALVTWMLFSCGAPGWTQSESDPLMVQLPVPDALATPAKGSL